jgi:hypothetical protein
MEIQSIEKQASSGRKIGLLTKVWALMIPSLDLIKHSNAQRNDY